MRKLLIAVSCILLCGVVWMVGLLYQSEMERIDRVIYWRDYHDIWLGIRDQVVEEVKKSVPAGRYTVSFCDYRESYLHDREVSTVIVIINGKRGENCYEYTFNRDGVYYVSKVLNPQIAYYKSRKFDSKRIDVKSGPMVQIISGSTSEAWLGSAVREKLALAFNHMIRKELDFKTHSLLQGISYQEARVKIYASVNDWYSSVHIAPKDGLSYRAFIALEGRIFEIALQADLPDYFQYKELQLYDGEMPGNAYEWSDAESDTVKKYTLLDEFIYTFDPNCAYPYENASFDLWLEVRDQAIEELKASTWLTGEYIFLFCNYDEPYFSNPKKASIVVISIGNGREIYHSLDIQSGKLDWWYDELYYLTDKERAYYKAREFDRETVYMKQTSIIGLPSISSEESPILDAEMQQKLIPALNEMVRKELDTVEGSPLEGALKQDMLIRVYAPEKSDGYQVFMGLQDCILYAEVNSGWYEEERLFCNQVRLHNAEMPGNIYAYTQEDSPVQQARLIGEFAYRFDPDRVVARKNEYFDTLWPMARDEVIGRAKQVAGVSGEYTFLFCDYVERPNPSFTGTTAEIVVIVIGNGKENYYTCDIELGYADECSEIFFSVPSGKEASYYKSREFDRATVYVKKAYY